MKKLVCMLIAVSMSFSVFAAGLSLTLDTIAGYDSEEGFSVGAGEDDYFLELAGKYECNFGGASFRLRNACESTWELNTGFPAMDRWDAYVVPCQYLKFGMGNTPLELYVENIRYEPITGAGLFENARNHFYVEVYPVDTLTFGFGAVLDPKDKEDADGNVTVKGTDKVKLWKTMAAWANYNISCVGNVTLEYESLDTTLSYYDNDGDVQRISGQFEYNGTDNLDVIASYSALIAKNGDGKFELAQNRIDISASYALDNWGFELYNAALIRNKDYGAFGDRLAAKVSYSVNDKLTPWIRFNYFHKYNLNEFGWGIAQLTTNTNKTERFWIEPKATFDLGKGITGIFGLEFDYYTKPTDKFIWRVPVELIISF